MDVTHSLDAATLFTVNATSLAVFASAYIVAWFRKSNQDYWLNLTVSNVLFAIAFIMFSRRIDGEAEVLLLPNCLLVIGLGFRWRAVRAFFGHRPSHLAWILFTAIVTGLFIATDYFSVGTVFGAVNVVIFTQIIMIIYALASEKDHHLPSRWGLVIAYGVIAASSLLRVVQGWMLDNNMSTLLPMDVFLDIHLLAAAIHIVASGAFSLSMAYEQRAGELQKMALHDPLTRLYNRLGLEKTFNKKLNSASSDYALLVIDIDQFKSINDAYGHFAGDAAIKHCGETIAGLLDDDAFAARIGGEEFVAVLPQTSLVKAQQVAERIRAAIETDEVKTDDIIIRFTVSIGLSSTESGQHAFSKLLIEADKNLYKAKAEGRNQVIATPDATTAYTKDSIS